MGEINSGRLCRELRLSHTTVWRGGDELAAEEWEEAKEGTKRRRPGGTAQQRHAVSTQSHRQDEAEA